MRIVSDIRPTWCQMVCYDRRIYHVLYSTESTYDMLTSINAYNRWITTTQHTETAILHSMKCQLAHAAYLKELAETTGVIRTILRTEISPVGQLKETIIIYLMANKHRV